MEKIGYALLLLAALGWLIGILMGIPRSFPSGIIGLLAMVGVGLLFVKVLKERLANKEDDHYDKTVEK
jgi:phosphate/sulfate permease